MKVLAVDTAGPHCSCAIIETGRTGIAVLAQASEDLGRGHAERLIPLVSEILIQAGVDLNAVDRFATTVGPGSFTGLRVGISAARGFGLATGAPVVGVSTLAALAEPVLLCGGPVAGTPSSSPTTPADSTGAVCATVDARHGNVYVQVFSADGFALTDAAIMPVTACADLPEFRSVVGSGAQMVSATVPFAVSVFSEAPSADPGAVARCGARIERPETAPPVPLYLKPPDAAPAPPPLPRRM